MVWKTRSCTAHGNPGTPSGLGCTEPAFLAVAYLFLLPFITWICSLVLFLVPGQDSLQGTECSFLVLQQCLVYKADPALLLTHFWSLCRHLWLSKARSFFKCEYCQELNVLENSFSSLNCSGNLEINAESTISQYVKWPVKKEEIWN